MARQELSKASMPRIETTVTYGEGMVAHAAAAGCAAGQSQAAAPEYNPVRRRPMAIGPEANRLIVGFRATPSNARDQDRKRSLDERAALRITQAQTRAADVTPLVQRVGLRSRALARSPRACMSCSCRRRCMVRDVVNALAEAARRPGGAIRGPWMAALRAARNAGRSAVRPTPAWPVGSGT